MISVIVPVYNVERYLRQCLDSIINQTYRDLEILLIDDGSPDRCGEICDLYAKKDIGTTKKPLVATIASHDVLMVTLPFVLLPNVVV